MYTYTHTYIYIYIKHSMCNLCRVGPLTIRYPIVRIN